MNYVYLMRHCQAAGQEPFAPLTEEGQRQAKVLAGNWSDTDVNCIISSPFVRAVQSVMPLAQRFGKIVKEDERLVERCLSTTPISDWQDHLRRSFAEPDYCLPSGESGQTAQKRGLDVVYNALERQGGRTIIVTHGNLLTLILNHFDKTFGYERWRALSNPDIYRLEVSDLAITIARIDWENNGQCDGRERCRQAARI